MNDSGPNNHIISFPKETPLSFTSLLPILSREFPDIGPKYFDNLSLDNPWLISLPSFPPPSSSSIYPSIKTNNKKKNNNNNNNNNNKKNKEKLTLFEKIVDKDILPLWQIKINQPKRTQNNSSNDKNNNNENNNNNNSSNNNNNNNTNNNNTNNENNNNDKVNPKENLKNEIEEIYKIYAEKNFCDYPLTIRKNSSFNSIQLDSILMTLHKMCCYLKSPMIIPLCKPWVYVNVLYVGQNPNTGNIIAVFSECLIS